MKSILTITLIILSALVVGCNGASNHNNNTKVIEIKGEQCPVELKTSFPLLYCFDNLLVTASCLEAPLFRVYRDNKEVYSYGAIGRGPKEFLSFLVTSVLGDTLLVNDTQHQSLIYLKVGDDGDGQYIKEVKRLMYQNVKSQQHNMSKTIGNVVKVDDDYFVGLAMWSDTSLFGLCDAQMNLVRYFGSLPFEADMEPLSLMSDFNGILMSRNNTIVYSMLGFAYITTYHIGDNGEIRPKWSDTVFPMEFEIRNGSMNLYREKAFGMCRYLYLTDKYIYLLVQETLRWDDYSCGVDSRIHPNAIYIYDYEGNRLCKLITDDGLMSFCVTEDDTEIIGVTAYDTKVIRYDIADIID